MLDNYRAYPSTDNCRLSSILFESSGAGSILLLTWLYRMFIPVEDAVGADQWIWVIDKDESGKVRKRKDMGVRYVPLTDTPT